MNRIWHKNKFIIIIIFIVVFMFPSAISRVSDYNSRLICLGIGVDLDAEGYIFSVQSLVPEQASSFKKNVKVRSARGKSVQQSVTNLTTHVGKDIGLAHCAFIVVNQNILDGELVNVIDFFIRKYQINYNSVVVATDKKAQDILLLSCNLNNSQGFGLNNILDYNNKNLFSRPPNIENVYASVLGGAPYYAIDIISTSSKPEDGIEAKEEKQDSQKSNNQGGDGEEDKDSVLVNNGDVFLMNKSQKLAKVNIEENVGVRYINPSNSNFNLSIAKFSDDIYNDATIELHSAKKVQANKYFFRDNVPIVEMNIVQYFNIINVVQESYTEKTYSISENGFSNKLAKACEEKIKEEINKGVEMLKKYNCDVSHVYNAFYKYDYYNWESFINGLLDKENYFKYIRFEPKITVKYYSD